LSQEIRSGARAAEAHERGVGVDAALKGAGVWPSRATPLKAAMARHNSASWLSMLGATTFESLCVQLSANSDISLPIDQASL